MELNKKIKTKTQVRVLFYFKINEVVKILDFKTNTAVHLHIFQNVNDALVNTFYYELLKPKKKKLILFAKTKHHLLHIHIHTRFSNKNAYKEELTPRVRLTAFSFNVAFVWGAFLFHLLRIMKCV